MRLLNAAADRLVAAIVPRTTAGACECRPEPWKECCSPHLGISRTCQYDCRCNVVCGLCSETNPGCK
jgi:hypothetical protein